MDKRSCQSHAVGRLSSWYTFRQSHFGQDGLLGLFEGRCRKFRPNQGFHRFGCHNGFRSHSTISHRSVGNHKFGVLNGQLDLHAGRHDTNVIFTATRLLERLDIFHNIAKTRDRNGLQHFSGLQVYNAVLEKEFRYFDFSSHNCVFVVQRSERQSSAHCRQHRVHIGDWTRCHQVATQTCHVSDLCRSKPPEHIVDWHDSTSQAGVGTQNFAFMLNGRQRTTCSNHQILIRDAHGE
mmetsp:Transcript_3278/g.6260  ORF Transcript_3278/g.6260 Transcript_3278/m.6260 type:complete len:236 (+) Transcript_3278:2822-3529(+)